MPDLLVSNLAKHYPTRAESLTVLRGASFELNSGQSLAILGPSGSGKSTLLYIVGTLEQPTSGRVEFAGRNPFELSEPKLAAFRNRQIGFVFQEHHLLPQCSVLENILLPTIAEGGPDAAAIQHARFLINRVGLTGRIEHRPAELSGGERQRVAIARALVRKPVVVLADEPTGNLDHSTALSVGKLLLELQREQNTMLVVVTHSLDLAALFDRRLELDDGRLTPKP